MDPDLDLRYGQPRCNIGPAEIARRRRAAIALTVVALGVAAALVAVQVPHLLRLAVWPFTAAAAVTWLEVVRKFCVRFGALGIQNFGPLGRRAAVDERLLSEDRRRAAGMTFEGALAGLLAAVALVNLPL